MLLRKHLKCRTLIENSLFLLKALSVAATKGMNEQFFLSSC